MREDGRRKRYKGRKDERKIRGVRRDMRAEKRSGRWGGEQEAKCQERGEE